MRCRQYQGVIGVENSPTPIALTVVPLPLTTSAQVTVLTPPYPNNGSQAFGVQILTLPRYGRLMASDRSLVLTPGTVLPSPYTVQYLPGLHVQGFPLDSFTFGAVSGASGLPSAPGSVSVSLLPRLTPLVAGPHSPAHTISTGVALRSVFFDSSQQTALVNPTLEGHLYIFEQGCSAAFQPSYGLNLSPPTTNAFWTSGSAHDPGLLLNFTLEVAIRLSPASLIGGAFPVQTVMEIVNEGSNTLKLVLAVCPPTSPLQGWAVLCAGVVVLSSDLNQQTAVIWAPLLAVSETQQWLLLSLVVQQPTAGVSLWQLYRQGVLMAQAQGTGTSNVNWTPLQFVIGTQDTANVFCGFIDNVVLWRSAHTAAQVATGVRYLPSRADVAGSDLWRWWPLEPVLGTTQDDLASGDFALTNQVPPGQPFNSVQSFSVCDFTPASTPLSQYQNVIPPAPPVDSMWVQTLTASSVGAFDVVQGFILTHAFGHLNDEALMMVPPIFTATVPSYGFLWQLSLDPTGTFLVREVIAYGGEGGNTANVSFVPSRLPAAARDVVKALEATMGISAVDEYVLFYSPRVFPLGVTGDPQFANDSFTLTATNAPIAAQQWATLQSAASSLQPSLTVQITSEASFVLNPMSGLQSTMATFTGSGSSYAVLDLTSLPISIPAALNSAQTVLFSFWLQLVMDDSIHTVLSCQESFSLAVEFGFVVLRVSGSVIFTIPAPPVGAWTSMVLLFPPVSSSITTNRTVQFVQNGDLLFAGPMPLNFQPALQCSQMIVGALLSTVVSTTASATYQSTASTSDVNPVNPAARGFLQGSLDALRLTVVSGFVNNVQTSLLSELIGNFFALYDPPPLQNVAQQQGTLFYPLLIAPYFTPTSAQVLGVSNGTTLTYTQPIAPLFVPSTSPVMARQFSYSQKGSAGFFLTFKTRFAAGGVLRLTSLPVLQSGTGNLTLYQVMDDGSEFGLPLLSQPLAVQQNISHPRLIVWAQPGVGPFFDPSASLPSTLTFTYAASMFIGGREVDQPSGIVSQASITFALPPALLFAQFSTSGSSISLYFDSATNGLAIAAASTPALSCVPFLSAPTVTLLSDATGANASCIWANASWLVVQPAAGSAVSVSSVLALNPRTLQGQTLSLYTVGNVTVRPPDTLLTTTVSVTGPSSVGRCGVARFDGYSTFGFRSSAQLVEADYAPFWEVDGSTVDALRSVPARVVYPIHSLTPITALHLLIRQAGVHARACIDELEVFGYDSALVQQMGGVLQSAEGSSANFSANLTAELFNLNLAYQSMITDSCQDPYADPFARPLNVTEGLSDAANTTDLSLLVDGVYGADAPWVACNQPQVWVTVRFPNPMVVDHITLGNLSQCRPTNLLLFTAQSSYLGATGTDVDSRVYRQRLSALHTSPDAAHLATVNSPEGRVLEDATTYGWSPLQLSALDVTDSGASIQIPITAEVYEPAYGYGYSIVDLCVRLPSQQTLDALAWKTRPAQVNSSSLFYLPHIQITQAVASTNASTLGNVTQLSLLNVSFCGPYNVTRRGVDITGLCLSYLSRTYTTTYYNVTTRSATTNATTTTTYNTTSSTVSVATFNGWVLLSSRQLVGTSFCVITYPYLTALSTGPLEFVFDWFYAGAANDSAAQQSPGSLIAGGRNVTALASNATYDPSTVNLTLSLYNAYVLAPIISTTYNNTVNHSSTVSCYYDLAYTDSMQLSPLAASSINCSAGSYVQRSDAWYSARAWVAAPSAPAAPVPCPVNYTQTSATNVSGYISGNVQAGQTFSRISTLSFLPTNGSVSQQAMIVRTYEQTVTSLQLLITPLPTSVSILCALPQYTTRFDNSSRLNVSVVSGYAVVQTGQVSVVDLVWLINAGNFPNPTILFVPLQGCVGASYVVIQVGLQPLVNISATRPQSMAMTIFSLNTVNLPGCYDSVAAQWAAAQSTRTAGATFTADRVQLIRGYNSSAMGNSSSGHWGVQVTANSGQAMNFSSSQPWLNSLAMIQGPAGEAVAFQPGSRVTFSASVGAVAPFAFGLLIQEPTLTASWWQSWSSAFTSTLVYDGVVSLVVGLTINATTLTAQCPVCVTPNLTLALNASQFPLPAYVAPPTVGFSHVTVVWSWGQLLLFVNGRLALHQENSAYLFPAPAYGRFLDLTFVCGAPPCAVDEVTAFNAPLVPSAVLAYVQQRYGVVGTALQAQVRLFQRQFELLVPAALLSPGEHAVQLSLWLDAHLNRSSVGSPLAVLYPQHVSGEALLYAYPNVRPISRFAHSNALNLSTDSPLLLAGEISAVDLEGCLDAALLQAPSLVTSYNPTTLTSVAASHLLGGAVAQGWAQSSGPGLPLSGAFLGPSPYLLLPAGLLQAEHRYQFDFSTSWANASSVLSRLSGPASSVASLYLDTTQPQVFVSAAPLTSLSSSAAAELVIDTLADVSTLFMVDPSTVSLQTLNALLQPQWSCSQLSVAPGASTACATQSGLALSLPHSLQLTIPTGTLINAATYFFQLVLSGSASSQSSLQVFDFVVFVSAQYPLPVSFAPLQSEVTNPTDDFTARVSALVPAQSGVDPTFLSWKWVVCDDHGPLQLSSPPTLSSASQTSNSSLTNATQTQLTGALTVPAGSFASHRQYSVLAVLVQNTTGALWSAQSQVDQALCSSLNGAVRTLSGLSSVLGALQSYGYASIALSANAGPHAGSCALNFTSAALGCPSVLPSVPFTVACANWTDDELPLSYAVTAHLSSLDGSNSSLLATLLTWAPSLTGQAFLAPVNVFEVFVDVSDAEGAVSRITIPVTASNSSACGSLQAQTAAQLLTSLRSYDTAVVQPLLLADDWLVLQSAVLLLPASLSAMHAAAGPADCSGSVLFGDDALLQAWQALSLAASGHVITEVSQSALLAAFSLLAQVTTPLASQWNATCTTATAAQRAQAASDLLQVQGLSFSILAQISAAEYSAPLSTSGASSYVSAVQLLTGLQRAVSAFEASSDSLAQAGVSAALLLQTLHAVGGGALLGAPVASARQVSPTASNLTGSANNASTPMVQANAVRTPLLSSQALANSALTVSVAPPSNLNASSAIVAKAYVDAVIGQWAANSSLIRGLGVAFAAPTLSDWWSFSASSTPPSALMAVAGYSGPQVTLGLAMTTMPTPTGYFLVDPATTDVSQLTPVLNVTAVRCHLVLFSNLTNTFAEAPGTACRVASVTAGLQKTVNGTTVALMPSSIQCRCGLQSSFSYDSSHLQLERAVAAQQLRQLQSPMAPLQRLAPVGGTAPGLPPVQGGVPYFQVVTGSTLWSNLSFFPVPILPVSSSSSSSSSSSTGLPTPPCTDCGSSASSHTGAIVGGVVGGLAACLLAGLLVWWALRARSSDGQEGTRGQQRVPSAANSNAPSGDASVGSVAGLDVEEDSVVQMTPQPPPAPVAVSQFNPSLQPKPVIRARVPPPSQATDPYAYADAAPAVPQRQPVARRPVVNHPPPIPPHPQHVADPYAQYAQDL